MTLTEQIQSWIGVPNDIVGEVMIITAAFIAFLFLYEAFLYFLWKAPRWGR